MKRAGDFLEKFKNITNKSSITRAVVADVLNDIFFIKIPNKTIIIKGDVIKIKTSGPFRVEIITQEKKIIKEINKRLGENIISRLA